MIRCIDRVSPATFGLVLALSVAPQGAAARRAGDEPRRLTFENAFAGVSADGESCMWEGPVRGEARGRLTIALRQVEGPVEAASPVWHVTSRWTMRDAAGRRSFVAELEGMVDWKAGTTRLAGPITAGWMRGAWVQAEGRLRNGDVTGSLLILPVGARR